ncbi:DNA excision repair protein ERCC-6 [Capronia epimyces CBS 606.96]|uniref:DNA excision repair protein ERCC-6 n=1 Tax=Capronia epimyces CBS 606.96 TaxID=1182542 RepID=W9YT74_9EURO|nr:DNA excision repair protein ERCC-6 [Capronia epimyces CBS 606.96]EXJ92845.1 DNA excision repair protein ERCC-6 [Capronia epimyces CBS 606.96]
MEAQQEQNQLENALAVDADMTDKGVDNGGTPKNESAETLRLRNLDAEVQDQDDVERNLGRKADRMLFEQANDRDQTRLDKTLAQKEKLQNQIRKAREEMGRPVGTTRRARLRVEIDRMQGQIQDLQNDIAEIEERMRERETDASLVGQHDASSTGRLPNETQRDYLIRTGKITPFSKFGLSTHGESSTTLQGALLDAEEEPELGEILPDIHGDKLMSHRNLRQPGFASSFADSSAEEEVDLEQPRKRRRLAARESIARNEDSSYDEDSVDDDVLSDAEEDDNEDMPVTSGKQKRSRQKAAGQIGDDVEDFRGVDDGTETIYQSRVKRWALRRRRARTHASGPTQNNEDDEVLDGESSSVALEEAHLPHPEIPDTVFNDGYKIPGDIYPSLFDYQKTGVQWLYELYTQQVGGIIGDEMGLGKTIQMIAFLAGLHYSRKLTKPIIVVCPATVMKQWVNEFHRWWPPFRVTILHSSGSGMVNLRNESSKEDELLDLEWDPTLRNRPLTPAQKAARNMLKPVFEDGGGVLVTTYSGLQTYAPLLIPVDWEYAILDEGHKIRNPNTAITIYCKELRTPNRIILSGTPMQNNLIELWSLFDFVFPMRLGTLVSFRNQFEIPIRQGGYANASNLQVQTAFKCAETLKDAISPYLLQRFKIDVASDLPKKSEQVLFCKLTPLQRAEYQRFLDSNEMGAIINGKRQVLYGVDILRKICNHPDLTGHKHLSVKPGYNYGDPSKSGKMQVVGALLELWKETGHKTLLFAQHRIMLDILEKYVRSFSGLKYRRMDGNTPIQLRQSMVDEFNTDPDLHVFLLTTKVGGLGINLTGADRVIIYDPDWNPSTDLQARERAWRLGQKREVTIYRLMTAGTIEEKIYHRQIFKQFLTNKILKDPKQRQTFHLNDLHDLFTLAKEGEPTETSNLFQDAEVKYPSGPAKAHEAGDKDADNNIAPKSGDTNIETLPGISSMERYAGEIVEEANANKEGSTNSEDRVMEGIFARSGIHSAVEHDAIIDGNKTGKKVAADPVLIEQEARKVAAEAARELRRAGDAARHVPIGTPTWTGQFGVSGRPQETTAQRAFSSAARSRGGAIQSTSLLANLQQRQANAIGSRVATPRTSSPARSSVSTASTSRAGTPTAPQSKDFGKLIRDFLNAHGGATYTQMLIDHFNRYCTTPQATMDFKETLKMIARLEKGSRGRGRWVLKEEYKK